MRSREQIFEALLASLGASDPLDSVVARAARLVRGSGLIVNEFGEVVRAIGSAPAHLISEWVLAEALVGEGEDAQTSRGHIGRWSAHARMVRIRYRIHALVLAVHEERSTDDSSTDDSSDVDLVLDTAVRILQAFEGFESFSMSTRREESARLMRELEAGVTPAREPAKWRALEDFGFTAYAPVRIVRARLSVGTRRLPAALTAKGIVLTDSGATSAMVEQTALCAEDFPLDDVFAPALIGAGVSAPFTALSQVPEMLTAADVALASAGEGRFVHVDDMRPVEWAAARMSSRFDRQVAQRFLDRLATGTEVWATLTAYIDAAGSVARTARRLQVHENTVRYRLGQVEAVLGARLSDPRAIADVVVALECRRTQV